VYANRSGSHQTRSGHVSAPDLRPGCVLSWNLRTLRGAARPPPGGGGASNPIPGVRSIQVGVLDQSWRSGLYISGSGTFPWGFGFTATTLEYITFSGHVAAPDPPMWWGQALLWTQSGRPRLG
jgi:hypothetical protein